MKLMHRKNERRGWKERKEREVMKDRKVGTKERRNKGKKEKRREG